MTAQLSGGDQTFVLGLAQVLGQFPDGGHVVIRAADGGAQVTLDSTGQGGIDIRATAPRQLSDVEMDAMRSLGWADPDDEIPVWQQLARAHEADRHINQVAAFIYATFAVVDHVTSEDLTYEAWIGNPEHRVSLSALGLRKSADS